MALIQLRQRADHEEKSWCVVHNGEVYPFGSDRLGLELAEWAKEDIENGDNYTPSTLYPEVIHTL